MKRYIFLVSLIILISCEKDSNDIPDTRYYDQEIITCRSYDADGEYCGKFKEFEYQQNNGEKTLKN